MPAKVVVVPATRPQGTKLAAVILKRSRDSRFEVLACSTAQDTVGWDANP